MIFENLRREVDGRWLSSARLLANASIASAHPKFTMKFWKWLINQRPPVLPFPPNPPIPTPP